MLWTFFSYGNLILFLRILVLVSQQILNPFIFRPVIRGKVYVVLPWRERLEIQRGLFQRVGFVCSGDRRKQCLDEGVWLFRKLFVIVK
jgi:hypothetical protein